MRFLPLPFVLCFFVLVGILRLFSLDAHWSADETLWLNRSSDFMSAVKRGQFSQTDIAYHPGVTTMWIAGTRTFFIDPRVDIKNLVHARFTIGIVVWLGIGIACILLYFIFGKWVAFVGGVSLTYSPFFLAETRRVHTDALAVTFILLTVLLFLLYCQNRQHRHALVFSGIAFALALLSKSYALILLPWVPFCLFLFRDRHSSLLLISIAEGLCFLSCTVLTVLALWPVFWTPIFRVMALCLLVFICVLLHGMKKERCSPLFIIAASLGLGFVTVSTTLTVWHIFGGVHWAVTTPHEVKHFFLGKVVNDPGWLFYPLMLTIKSTPLMLPLVLIGCYLHWKRQGQTEQTTCLFHKVIAIVVCVVLFIFFLSITSKKLGRYLLPIFPLLDILAAIAFVTLIQWGNTKLKQHSYTHQMIINHVICTVTCIVFFFIQIFPIIACHPYYGTYYNFCWKVTDITKIITVGDASGIDIAAKYLHQNGNARHLRVAVSPLSVGFFQKYFVGFSYDARKKYLPADYEVVYIRDAQIGQVPQTGTRNGELEHVISLNGIDHVWIYKVN